ncbi:hypothetical protein BGZ83_003533 [Gryganskiella cystojenkinii]|nr:hypothetical protein BGZ83_003533 [Gryganskiella cystojenkinii]
MDISEEEEETQSFLFSETLETLFQIVHQKERSVLVSSTRFISGTGLSSTLRVQFEYACVLLYERFESNEPSPAISGIINLRMSKPMVNDKASMTAVATDHLLGLGFATDYLLTLQPLALGVWSKRKPNRYQQRQPEDVQAPKAVKTDDLTLVGVLKVVSFLADESASNVAAGSDTDDDNQAVTNAETSSSMIEQQSRFVAENTKRETVDLKQITGIDSNSDNDDDGEDDDSEEIVRVPGVYSDFKAELSEDVGNYKFSQLIVSSVVSAVSEHVAKKCILVVSQVTSKRIVEDPIERFRPIKAPEDNDCE